MTVYVLVHRNGTNLGEPDCKTEYLKIYEKMKNEFDATVEELEQEDREIESASCSDFEASIDAGGEVWEWLIYTFVVEEGE